MAWMCVSPRENGEFGIGDVRTLNGPVEPSGGSLELLRWTYGHRFL